MGNIITKQNFLEPFVILLREGTPEDPYVDITEKIKTVSMPTGLEIGIAILREIPLFTQGVIATRKSDGVELEEIRDSLTVPDENQFKVDYTNGRVYLDSANNNEEITYQYKGRGVILVTGERIIINNGQSIEYIKTLQDLVEEMESELLVGNLNNLLTIDKSYVVNALNEVFKMAKTPLNSTGVVLASDKIMKKEANILTIPQLVLYFKDQNDFGDFQVGVVTVPTQDVEVPIPSASGIITYSVFIGMDGTISFDEELPKSMYSNKILLGFVCMDLNAEIAESFVFNSMQMATTDMLSRQEDLLFINSGIYRGGQISGNENALTISKTEYNSVTEGIEPTNIDNPHLHTEPSSIETQFYQFIPNGILELSELILQTELDSNNYSLNGVKTEVPEGMFTIQRFLEFNNGYSAIVYGEELFDTMDTALIAINNLKFSNIDIPHTETNRIVVQQGTTDLSVPEQCRIVYMNDANSGSGGTSAREQFNDRDFVLYNSFDNTKQMKFDLSGISANVSRKLMPLDKDYTIADNADVLDLYDRTAVPYLTSGIVKPDNLEITISGSTLSLENAKVYFQRINKVLDADGDYTLPNITGYYTFYLANDNTDAVTLTYLEDELNYYTKYMVRLCKVHLTNGLLDDVFYAEVPHLAQTSQLERTYFANDGAKAYGGHIKAISPTTVNKELISYLKEGIDFSIDGDKNIINFAAENPMQFKYVKSDFTFNIETSNLDATKYLVNNVPTNVQEDYFTIQRHIVLCDGQNIIEYGTAQYKNMTEARNALATQSFNYLLKRKGKEMNRIIIQNNSSLDIQNIKQCEIYYTNGSGISLGGVGSSVSTDDLTTVVNDDGYLEIKGTSEIINNPPGYTKAVYTAVRSDGGDWYFNWEKNDAGHIIYTNDTPLGAMANLVFKNYNNIVNNDEINDSTIVDLNPMVTAFKYKGAMFFYDDRND